LSFLPCTFLSHSQNWDGCGCVVLFLGLPLCSIGLHVCFCASTMLLVILWVCSIILKSSIVVPPVLLFLLRVAFAIQGLLCEI
jgi:hypothetical protein